MPTANNFRLLWNLARLRSRWRGFCRLLHTGSRCAGGGRSRHYRSCCRHARCCRCASRWRRRNRHSHWHGSGRQIIKHTTTNRRMTIRTQIRQGQRGGEKDYRSNAGRLRKKVGRTSRTEQTTRRARSKGCPHVRAFAVLQEHETDNRQRRQDLHQHDDIDKQCIH